jgi:hypothetical protein
VDPVPDPLLLRKSGSAGDRTRDLCIRSQKLWPLDHRGGPRNVSLIIKSKSSSPWAVRSTALLRPVSGHLHHLEQCVLLRCYAQYLDIFITLSSALYCVVTPSIWTSSAPWAVRCTALLRPVSGHLQHLEQCALLRCYAQYLDIFITLSSSLYCVVTPSIWTSQQYVSDILFT